MSGKKPWQIWLDRRGRWSALRVGTLALLLAPAIKAIYDASAIAHSARPINELIHRAGSRDIFASGAIHAALALAGRPPGLQRLRDLL